MAMDLTYMSLHNYQVYEFTLLVKRPSISYPCVYTGKANGWQIKRLIKMRDLIVRENISPDTVVLVPSTAPEEKTEHPYSTSTLRDICKVYGDDPPPFATSSHESEKIKSTDEQKRRRSCIIL